MITASVRITLGLLALVAAAACAFDYHEAGSQPWRVHVEWRTRLARRFSWAPPAPNLDDPRFRWRVYATRVGFTVLFLLMAVALIASGIAAAFD